MKSKRVIQLGVCFLILFIGLSTRISPQNLGEKIVSSNLIFIGEVDHATNSFVSLNPIEFISCNKKRKSYKLSFKKINHHHRLPSNKGRYIVFSRESGRNINARTINALFRIIDGQILITNPYLHLLKENGLSRESEIFEEFQNVLVKNKSSNSYGILVDLDDFVKFIKELKSTDALSSLTEKYPKGSIEYALVSQINNVSSE